MAKISKKIIANYKKLQLGKVINFSALKLAKAKLSKIDLEEVEKFWQVSSDPNHKIYSIIQHQLSYFAEEVSILKEFKTYYDIVEQVEDEYMPSYPPGSPLTVSYFTYWAFCDLTFGREKETIATIFNDVAAKFDFDKIILKGLANLNASCMRFYQHLGFDNNLIVLKDLLTDKTYSCVSTSRYKGSKNQIWFVRIVPNLDEVYDYHLTLTTPYIILNYSEKDWLDFFQRQGIRKEEVADEKKYISFLKYHKDFRFWHDYVMDAYVNFESNCIFLTGIPDIKGSKPHEIGDEF